MFHALGFAHAMLGVALGSTLVVRRRFDPQATLDSLDRHQASAMVVVPVMLQRMLDLGPRRAPASTSARSRSSSSPAPSSAPSSRRRAIEAFGPVVYNLYGSTEVAYATIATPADLRGRAGVCRPGRPRHRRQDSRRRRQRAADRDTGRIFVGNSVQFEGYTGGGDKDGSPG